MKLIFLDTLQATLDNETIFIKLHEHVQHHMIQKEQYIEADNITNNKAVQEREEPLEWIDASTKLFLEMYKNVTKQQKTKTKKRLWCKLSETLQSHGYNVSANQVENKFKSLDRSYKNMVTNNKKTGRHRASCPYETELTELFANKHNIIPLAVSGSEGTIVRDDVRLSLSKTNTDINCLSTGGLANVQNNNNVEADGNSDVGGQLTAIHAETSTPSTSNTTRSNNTNNHSNYTLPQSNRKQLTIKDKRMEIYQQQIETLMQDIRQERQERFEVQKQMQNTYNEYLKKIYEAIQERNEIFKQLIPQSQSRNETE
ncbi:uncharacterized protein LOC116841753 [Odontomachus brunneus]|uniref:uncharacterized protein LOC116841753 n=1 Tax=Odontomachus brunneus TaxID=486640 RepID=UPI0013F18F55|nr:uncharacterized protein LOC116841753 [Odontomachus brunneus]XP_032665987.1 uncharacterized protein LOC116841753 [Odontomachus brunneus]XP_032665996.1 uncharacterized protein LOC116841753 [Odontomachus brunneus]